MMSTLSLAAPTSQLPLARGAIKLANSLRLVKTLFHFRLGRDQLFTFGGPDRQLHLFAAAAGRNRRGNAISVFRIGLHAVVEQYRVAALQRYAQRRGRFDTEELKTHVGRLDREIDQDALVRMRHVAHADRRAVG